MAKMKLRIGEVEVEVEGEKGSMVESKASEYFEKLIALAYPKASPEPTKPQNYVNEQQPVQQNPQWNKGWKDN